VTPAPIKPTVALAALEAVDIRLGTIQAVDAVPGSRMLVRLTVKRRGPRAAHPGRAPAGAARPAALVGRQALFVVNLPPKRMAGEVSEGMLLDIGDADGLTPALAVPERPLPDGARAG
jgi:tRNA-binding EMAP/Myf-like protein